MIQVGLVRVGHWGPNVARSFELTERASMAWLCDLDGERLEGLGITYLNTKSTARFTALLAAVDCQLART